MTICELTCRCASLLSSMPAVAVVDAGVDAGRESCIVAVDPVGAREHRGRRRRCEEEREWSWVCVVSAHLAPLTSAMSSTLVVVASDGLRRISKCCDYKSQHFEILPRSSFTPVMNSQRPCINDNDNGRGK